MRKVLFLLILFIFVLASVAQAGPTVAIIKSNNHELVGKSWQFKDWHMLPQGPRWAKGKYWHPVWSRKSEREIEKMVRKAVKLVGGLPVEKGDVVWIKTNVVASFNLILGTGKTRNEEIQCYSTDPRIVRAIALLAKRRGAKKIYIAAGPPDADGIANMKTYGYEGLARETGAELYCINSAPYKWYKPERPLALKEYALSVVMVEEADKIISVSPMKTHYLTGITGTLKNQAIGSAPNRVYGIPKVGLPHNQISEVICDIVSIKKIDFAVISAIWGSEGHGPTKGDPVSMDLVIVGRDPVAVDAVETMVMGFKPENYGHITLAEQMGLGTMKDINVVGDPIKKVMKKFKPVPKELRAPNAWGRISGWD